jgi:hypothetical protein
MLKRPWDEHTSWAALVTSGTTALSVHARRTATHALRDSHHEPADRISESNFVNPFQREPLNPSRVLLAMLCGLLAGLAVLLFECL